MIAQTLRQEALPTGLSKGVLFKDEQHAKLSPYYISLAAGVALFFSTSIATSRYPSYPDIRVLYLFNTPDNLGSAARSCLSDRTRGQHVAEA